MRLRDLRDASVDTSAVLGFVFCVTFGLGAVNVWRNAGGIDASRERGKLACQNRRSAPDL